MKINSPATMKIKTNISHNQHIFKTGKQGIKRMS